MNVPAFERKLNILIAIPSQRIWEDAFGMCLLNMFSHLMAEPVAGFRQQRMVPMQVKGSILSRSRAKLVQTALKQQCTHLLFIDTDQTFPKDTAHRLLGWRKQVVACNVATKQLPATPTARLASDTRPDGVPVYTELGQQGLQKVWRVGTGIMLIDMKVFEKVGMKVFGINWVDALQDYMGEDWAMVEAFEKAGVDIYIDHGLSWEVKHIGSFAFGMEHCVDRVTFAETPQKSIGEA